MFQAVWAALVGALWLSGHGLAATVVLLLAALASALLLKRAACAFACPLFPAGELLWRSGRRLFGRNLSLPFWLDLLLRPGKYLFAGWLLFTLAREGAVTLPPVLQPLLLPLLVAVPVLSLALQMPWCRYLCPAGALFGLAATLSLAKIRRTPPRCVRCHRCSNRCPASLPVMLRTTVRSPECFSCYRCVDGCPAPGALAFALPAGRALPALLVGLLLSGFLLVALAAGIASGLFAASP
ncbi:MAG: 4Fe-4S binding protein [Deltaproteobacteria bacterium]|nr:MAG: 4Fe-4S binding protein [Deltaproteobacteria bacterium]